MDNQCRETDNCVISSSHEIFDSTNKELDTQISFYFIIMELFSKGGCLFLDLGFNLLFNISYIMTVAHMNVTHMLKVYITYI
jgi:hypothetical protein